MIRYKQPPQKACPKCRHKYHVTSECKGCDHILDDWNNKERAYFGNSSDGLWQP